MSPKPSNQGPLSERFWLAIWSRTEGAVYCGCGMRFWKRRGTVQWMCESCARGMCGGR